MKKIILMIVMVVVLASTVSAYNMTEQQKILASNAGALDKFGISVSISSDGNTAIVGANSEDTSGADAGAAYIFQWNGTDWDEQQKILASDGEASDKFGISVSISSDGNTAIVGANREDASAGAAYIFQWNGTAWYEQQKILASNAEAGDYFGNSVSISSDGNTAIVGANMEDDGGSWAGAAYIFRWNGTAWYEQQKINANDAAGDDQFGVSVSISPNGNTAIVAAYTEDEGGADAGAAYIFQWNGTVWYEQIKILASDAGAADRFGNSVSISSDGNTAIVGAFYEDDGGSNAGAAYIFQWNGTAWHEQQKINANDAGAVDRFGNSVSISSDGNTAIVGAFYEDDGGSNAGAAYIFQWNGTAWHEQQKINANDAGINDYLGVSVSISSDGNTAIVGAEGKDSSAGAAYIFQSTTSPLLPTSTTFTSEETTNFSEVTLSSVTSLTLAIDNKGKIAFPSDHSINAEDDDYDTNIVIEDEFISVNTAVLDSTFNSSATLTLEGVTCPVQTISYKEGAFISKEDIIAGGRNCELDEVCSNIQCNAGVLTFDVAHFTGFAAGADANLTTEAEAGVFYPLDPIEFTAEYVNSTDGTPISGECNITFDDEGTWHTMDFDNTDYNYTKSFAAAGLHEYNVTCSSANFVTLEANDTKLVSSIDIPEFSVLTLGLGLMAVLIGLIIVRRKK